VIGKDNITLLKGKKHNLVKEANYIGCSQHFID